MIRMMVTGHRPVKLGGYGPSPLQDAVRAWLRDQILRLHGSHGGHRATAISGMALGVDQWFCEEAMEVGVPVEAYVPFAGQESRWPAASQAHYRALLSRCERVVVCSEGAYSPRAMQLRNERMVDAADVHLAVWDGTPGGTANCVTYMTTRNLTPLRFPFPPIAPRAPFLIYPG